MAVSFPGPLGLSCLRVEVICQKHEHYVVKGISDAVSSIIRVKGITVLAEMTARKLWKISLNQTEGMEHHYLIDVELVTKFLLLSGGGD